MAIGQLSVGATRHATALQVICSYMLGVSKVSKVSRIALMRVVLAVLVLVAVASAATLRSHHHRHQKEHHGHHHRYHSHHHHHHGEEMEHEHSALYGRERLARWMPEQLDCVAERLGRMHKSERSTEEATARAVRSCVTAASIRARIERLISHAEQNMLEEHGSEGKRISDRCVDGTECQKGYECYRLESRMSEEMGYCFQMQEGECEDDTDCPQSKPNCVLDNSEITLGTCREAESSLMELTEPELAEETGHLTLEGMSHVEPTSAAELAKKPASDTVRSPGTCGADLISHRVVKPKLATAHHLSDLTETGQTWETCGKKGYAINCDDPEVRNTYAYNGEAKDVVTTRMAFHVVHSSTASANEISQFKSNWDTKVRDQLGTLNSDYASTGIKFKGTVYWWSSATLADVKVASYDDSEPWCQWCVSTNNAHSACVAQIDCCAVKVKAGLITADKCTSFSSYTQKVMASGGNDEHAPNFNSMFSIYPVTFTQANLLGWAYFPWDSMSGSSAMNQNAMGANQRTLSHELGHALGLYHTFHGVSEQESSTSDACTRCYERTASDVTGDLCEDTNPTSMNFACSDPASQMDGCTLKPWTNTPFTNIMGYAADSCMESLTKCQGSRMRCWLKAGSKIKNFVEEEETPECTKKCSNGGSLDAAKCACNCATPWTGDTCDTCSRTCGSHGNLDDKTCTCKCDAGFSGDNCDNNTCSKVCKNNGALDKGTCTCKCTGPWTGDTCDTCSRKCQNGGTLDGAACSCKCLAPWMGDTCEGNSCTKECANGGTLDVSTCTCKCKDGWKGDTCGDEVCGKDCKHGTLDDKACLCNCNPNWTGDLCDKCTRVCQNSGTLKSDTCECDCKAPWTGDDCSTNTCTKKCSHNGVLNAVTCICTCAAPWDGDTCDNCSLSCHNGGSLDKAECKCSCPDPWTGTRCEQNSCKKTCGNGGELDQKSCACKCSGAWTGDTCQDCGRKCENGGSLDASTCKCTCSAGWKGNECQFCGLQCKHSATIPEGTCQCKCEGNWKGELCDKCGITCKNGGSVTGDCTCACPNTHSGEDCSQKVVPEPPAEFTCTSSSQCGTGGLCDNGKCDCAWGYFGSKCEKSVCGFDCANGGHKFTYSSLNRCYCNCFYPWGGPTCDRCERTEELCGVGMSLDKNSCKCVIKEEEEKAEDVMPQKPPASSVDGKDYLVKLVGCTQDMPRKKWDLIIVPRGDIVNSEESPRHCAALCDKKNLGFTHVGVKYGGYICQCTMAETLPTYKLEECNLTCNDGESCGADKPHIFSYYSFTKKTAELDEPSSNNTPTPSDPGNNAPAQPTTSVATNAPAAQAGDAADTTATTSAPVADGTAIPDGAETTNPAPAASPAPDATASPSSATTMASQAVEGGIENKGQADSAFTSAAEQANSGLKMGQRVNTHSPVMLTEAVNATTPGNNTCTTHSDCSSDENGLDLLTGEPRGKCNNGKCSCEYWAAGKHCELECLRGLQDFGVLSKLAKKDYKLILKKGYVERTGVQVRQHRMGLGCSGNGRCEIAEEGSNEVKCTCNNGYRGDACQLPHSFEWEKRFPMEGNVYPPVLVDNTATAHMNALTCDGDGSCN